MGKLFTFNNGETVYLQNVNADDVFEDPYPKEFYENKKKYGRKKALEILKKDKKKNS